MMSPATIEEPVADDLGSPDLEALIEEARRRTRRRRVGYAAGLGLLILGAVIGLITASGGGSPKRSPVTPRSPVTVNARAFQGHGVLAFVSKGSLYVLDGATGHLAHIGDPGHTAADPTLSRDGRWLAYLELGGTPGPGGAESVHAGPGAYQLWLARADGSDAHRIASVTNGQIVGWSPSRDVLAVINWPSPNWTCRSKHGTTSVELVTPRDAVRRIYALSSSCPYSTAVYGAAWSPDGGSLAIAKTAFQRTGSSTVFAINIRTGARRTWFVIRNSQRLPGVCSGCVPDGIIPDLAAWWPKRGIGFWVFSSGMTHNNDGSPFEVVRAPAARPVRLGTSLSDGAQAAVAASSTGALAIVDAADRDIGSGGTEVQTCATGATRCLPVPSASIWNGAVSFTCHPDHPYLYCYRPRKPGTKNSGVSLDPNWSPNGSLLAYVAGPAAPQAGTPTAQWLNQHQLFLYDPTTETTRGLPGTEGASAPQWSADGRNILYVSHDSLWLLNLKSRGSARIAGPLFGGASFESAYDADVYYHQVPFTQQFGWSS